MHTMRHQYEPLSFCLNFLSLPFSLAPCFRCFTLQPVREYDQKSKCRTQHAVLIISGSRALLMSRRLDSHNSKASQGLIHTSQGAVRQSTHVDRGLRNLMMRIIGPRALARSPGASVMPACATHVPNLAPQYARQSWSIFSLVLTSAHPPTWCL